MNVDLHTHTYPASDCSHISFRDYIAWCVEHGVEAVALTNHGDVSDNRKLEPALAAEGVLLVHGVEISTLFGDFVVFSPDLDFLSTFADVQDAPRAGELPEDAAVVWVHPAAGGGRSGSAYYPGLERMVAGVVDAVEVYNGSWLDERYVTTAELGGDLLGGRHVALVEPAAVVDLHRVDDAGDHTFEAGVVGGAAAPAARRRVHPHDRGVLREFTGSRGVLHVGEGAQEVEVRREDDEVAEQRADLDPVDEQHALGGERRFELAVVGDVAVIGESHSFDAVLDAPGDVVAEADVRTVRGGVGVRMQVDVHLRRL